MAVTEVKPGDMVIIKTKYKIYRRFEVTGYWGDDYLVGNVLHNNGLVTKDRVVRMDQVIC